MKLLFLHKILLLVSLTNILSLSVSRGQGFVKYAKLEPISESLTDVEFHTSSFVVVRDWIFIQDELSEFKIQVYDLKMGDKVYEFGRRGRGPGEYLNIYLQPGPKSTQLEISDVTNKKNDIYDVTCLQKKPPISQSKKCIIESVPTLASRQAIILESDLIINHGSTPDGVLFLSRGSQTLDYIDKVPEEIKAKYKRPIHEAMVMSGLMASNNNRTHFAYFADSFDRILFYKRKAKEVELINTYEYTFIPEFEVLDFGGSSMLNPSETYRSAFRSPTAGSKHYFVLYSGKSKLDVAENLQDIEGADWRAFSNIVKVFDWYGSLVTEIQLDKQVLFISINYNEDTLYAVTFNENIEASIVKAKIIH